MNEKQSEELARFFMDLAKGLAIGMFGLTTFSNLSILAMFVYFAGAGMVVFVCVKIGLRLLQK